jgi:hypothetical protein
LATGTDPASSGSLAQELDRQLGLAMEQAGGRFDRAVQSAQDALSGTDIGVAVLTVLAVVAAAVGVWPRIAEYR